MVVTAYTRAGTRAKPAWNVNTNGEIIAKVYLTENLDYSFETFRALSSSEVDGILWFGEHRRQRDSGRTSRSEAGPVKKTVAWLEELYRLGADTDAGLDSKAETRTKCGQSGRGKA